jgi:hypothetical protein
MIRDWRQLQQSRINAKYIAANQQLYGNPYGQPIYGYQYYTTVALNQNLADV